MQAVEAVGDAGFRAHPRRAIHLRATVRRGESAWQSDGTVLNVGLGGACVALARSPKVGDEVTISFAAPTFYAFARSSEGNADEPFALGARVMWVRSPTPSEPARAGLAFDHTNPADLQLLLEFLANL